MALPIRTYGSLNTFYTSITLDIEFEYSLSIINYRDALFDLNIKNSVIQISASYENSVIFVYDLNYKIFGILYNGTMLKTL